MSLNKKRDEKTGELAVRKLGTQETMMYWGWHQFAGRLDILLSVMVETDKTLEVSMLEEALQNLQGRMQILRCRVQDLNGELWLTESVRQHVQVKLLPRGDDWHCQYERIFNDEVLDLDQGPMWRALLLQDPSNTGEEDVEVTGHRRAVIYLVISHVISDGMSNMFLVGQLLDILDHKLKKQPYLETEQILVKETVETSLKNKFPSWSKIIFWLFLSTMCLIWYKIRNWRRYSFSELFLRPPSSITQHRNRAVHSVLSRQVTASLLAACQHQGVTLGALLIAATNLAAAQLTDEERPGLQLSADTPIMVVTNQKRYLPPTDAGYVRCESGGLLIYVPLLSDEKGLWKMAHSAHSNVQQQLAELRPLAIHRLVTLFWRAAKRPLQIPGRWIGMQVVAGPSGTAFLMNNYGQMDAQMPRTSQVRILQLFTRSRMHRQVDLVPGGHLFGSVAGRLQHGFYYIDSRLEPQHAERYSKIVAEILERAARQYEAAQYLPAVNNHSHTEDTTSDTRRNRYISMAKHPL